MEKCYIIFVFLTFICGISAIGNYYLDDYCGSTINIGFNNQVRLRLTRSYNYPRNFRCEVTVKTDIGDRMMMFFKDLDIENTCSNDWLEMDDGQSRSSPYIGGDKKCGYSTPTRVYTTSGRYMTVYFQSDGSIQGKGFDMVITSFHTGYCYSWEFNCGNGRCIDNGLRCNGYNPCGDHTDCNILSSGGIAGIVIGSLALAAIIIVAVVVCRRRRGVIVRRTAMPGVATVHTTTVGGYAYNQPVPQSYAVPPPPYPGQPATSAPYPGTTAVQYPAPTTVQY